MATSVAYEDRLVKGGEGSYFTPAQIVGNKNGKAIIVLCTTNDGMVVLWDGHELHQLSVATLRYIVNSNGRTK